VKSLDRRYGNERREVDVVMYVEGVKGERRRLDWLCEYQSRNVCVLIYLESG
jgi:hypothetical protein